MNGTEPPSLMMQDNTNTYQRPQALLIEPSRLHQEILLNTIQLAGLTAITSRTGEEALEILNEKQFQLIIGASEMLKWKEFLLVKSLRDKYGDGTPILMMTSSDDKKIMNLAFSNGITEVIHRNHLVSLEPYFIQIKEAHDEIASGIGSILCVEDSRPISDLIKCALEEEGHQVDTLTKAEDALELFESGKTYDLLITDILLEGKMTGIRLIREIRQQSRILKRMPILAISGLDKIEQRIEALKQGATDFVSKPVNLDELAVRTRNLINAKKLYDKVAAQEKALRKMVVTDQLTGLYNRYYLSDAGLKRVEEARRHGQSLSLLIIDIDHFKRINDNNGHAIGDAVLRLVGELLKRSCRGEDFAVRFGGEEFVLVLPHCDLKDALDKAETLRQSIKDLKPEGLSVTASFGVSSFGESLSVESFDELFRLADEAVYKAKENGRDQVVGQGQDSPSLPRINGSACE